MSDLYLNVHGKFIAIDRAIADKYGLSAGELSPFTRAPLVDATGNAKPPQDAAQNLQGTKGELINDGISELENGVTLSQSEILDISAGVDSQMK